VEFAEGGDVAETRRKARRAFLLRFHPDLLRAQPAGEQLFGQLACQVVNAWGRRAWH
jgi:hypothetical protein